MDKNHTELLRHLKKFLWIFFSPIIQQVRGDQHKQCTIRLMVIVFPGNALFACAQGRVFPVALIFIDDMLTSGNTTSPFFTLSERKELDVTVFDVHGSRQRDTGNPAVPAAPWGCQLGLQACCQQVGVA